MLYRLKGFLICLPPLRDRDGDLGLLIKHFLPHLSRKIKKEVLQIDPEVTKALEAYHWPGNVRELESLLRQALITTTGTVIATDCLPDLRCFQKRDGDGRPEMMKNGKPYSSNPVREQVPHSDLAAFVEHRIDLDSRDLYFECLELMERCLLTRVLRETGGNQSTAARMLGITRGSLRNKIRTLRLSINHVVSVPAMSVDGMSVDGRPQRG